jgi:hypothetical protein
MKEILCAISAREDLRKLIIIAHLPVSTRNILKPKSPGE